MPSHTRNAFHLKIVFQIYDAHLTKPGPEDLKVRRLSCVVTSPKNDRLIVLTLSFAFLFLCGVTGAAGRMADRMILYVHVAGLYAKSS